MACECGEKYLGEYPARNSFSIQLSVNPVSKLNWTSDRVVVCIFCGDNPYGMPMDVLQELRDADPELAA
jgi:hypothetical protein